MYSPNSFRFLAANSVSPDSEEVSLSLTSYRLSQTMIWLATNGQVFSFGEARFRSLSLLILRIVML